MTGNYARLTDRQRECLAAVCRHGGGKEAARSLFVEPKSLQGVLGRVYRTLGVRGKHEACYLLGRLHAHAPEGG